MPKSPAVLFYTSDFLTGTTLMTYAQKGKYIHLLCLQHQQGHLSKEDFFSICDQEEHKIISKFIIDENGYYFNSRMEEETLKRNAYTESRSNNRMQKSLENKEKPLNDICQSYDKHMDNDNIYKNSILKSNKRESVREREEYFKNEELNDLFNDFLELRIKLKAQNTERAVKLLLTELEKVNDESKIKMIEQSITNSWKGLFELKKKKGMSSNDIDKLG